MDSVVDIVALVLFLCIIGKAFFNGLVLSVIDFISLICGYACAYLLAKPIGAALYAVIGVYKAFCIVAGGLLAIALVSVIFMIVKHQYKKKKKTEYIDKNGETRAKYVPHIASRISVSFLSIPIGLFAASFIFWAYTALIAEKSEDLKYRIGSYPARIVVEKVVAFALSGMDDSGMDPNSIATLISDPAGAAKKINSVLAEPAVKRIFNDRDLMDAIMAGNQSSIYQSSSFDRLFNNKVAMDKLQTLGVVPDNYGSKKYKASIAKKLAEVGGRVTEVKKDPEVKDVLAELQAEGKLQQGNISQLMTDLRFLKVLDKVLADQ